MRGPFFVLAVLALLAPPATAQEACALLEEARDTDRLPLHLIPQIDSIEMALRARDPEECADFLDRAGLETERLQPIPADDPSLCEETGAGACTGIPGTLASGSL